MPDFLIVLALALPVIPALRTIAWRELWTRQRVICLCVTLGLAGYAVLVATVWYRYQDVLPLAASLAAAVAVFFWWRARPSFGTGRGLPPGTLGMVDSLRSLLDHRYYLGQEARYGRVFKISQFNRPVVCVADVALGRDLIRRHEDKLMPPPLQFDCVIPGRFIRYMEVGDHRRYRGVLKAIIRPEIVSANEETISAACRTQLRRVWAASREKPGVHPMEYMRDLCYDIFPVIFFGLRPDSPELARLRAHYDRLDAADRGNHCSDQVEGIVRDIESIIRARDRELARLERDTPTSFLEALAIHEPAAIDDVTLRRNLVYVLRTTRGDVTGLLNWIWYFVARDPSVLEAVGEQPADGRAMSWLATAADRIVAETLRLEQSEYLYREAREDVRWKGFLIPKGWLVRVCTRDAHRQERHFPDPERFDPDRFLHRQMHHDEYAPFGMGRHGCLGIQLTFAVARAFLCELKESYEVRLVERGSRTLGARHWVHWRPDESFSIRLDLRQA